MIRRLRRLFAEGRIEGIKNAMLRHGVTHSGCDFEEGCEQWWTLCNRLDAAYDGLP